MDGKKAPIIQRNETTLGTSEYHNRGITRAYKWCRRFLDSHIGLFKSEHETKNSHLGQKLLSEYPILSIFHPDSYDFASAVSFFFLVLTWWLTSVTCVDQNNNIKHLNRSSYQGVLLRAKKFTENFSTSNWKRCRTTNSWMFWCFFFLKVYNRR